MKCLIASLNTHIKLQSLIVLQKFPEMSTKYDSCYLSYLILIHNVFNIIRTLLIFVVRTRRKMLILAYLFWIYLILFSYLLLCIIRTCSKYWKHKLVVGHKLISGIVVIDRCWQFKDCDKCASMKIKNFKVSKWITWNLFIDYAV